MTPQQFYKIKKNLIQLVKNPTNTDNNEVGGKYERLGDGVNSMRVSDVDRMVFIVTDRENKNTVKLISVLDHNDQLIQDTIIKQRKQK